jgi:hypothetical protein
MWLHVLVGSGMIVVSAALVLRHRAAWRRSIEQDASDDERRFARGQWRRRVQTSGMVGIVGVMIGAGPWVQGPWVVVCYWIGAVLLVAWMLLLAIADVLATRMHFSRLSRDHVVEHLRLHAELRRARRAARQLGHDPGHGRGNANGNGAARHDAD